jgi:hypothetical protein
MMGAIDTGEEEGLYSEAEGDMLRNRKAPLTRSRKQDINVRVRVRQCQRLKRGVDIDNNLSEGQITRNSYFR